MIDRIGLAEISFHFLSQTLKEGDPQLLAKLGFSPAEIAIIESLTLKQLRHLAQFGARYLLLKFDHDCFCKALVRVQDQQWEDNMQQEFVRLGAPAGMMKVLFGITRHEFAEYRRHLGLSRPGRPRMPDDDQLVLLRRQWKSLCDLPLSDRYLTLARSTGLSMASIWLVTDQLEVSGSCSRQRASSLTAYPGTSYAGGER